MRKAITNILYITLLTLLFIILISPTTGNAFWGNDGLSRPQSPTAPLADTTNPTVTVLSPDGRETWQAGTSQDITWSASDDVGVSFITLHYSVDGGFSWTSIDPNEPNDGTFSWLVPFDPSSSARVRVTAYDAAGNIGFDISDSDFTIEIASAPQNIVVYPDSLGSNQTQDEVIVDTLTISNTGDSDLDWSILEKPSAATNFADKMKILTPTGNTLSRDPNFVIPEQTSQNETSRTVPALTFRGEEPISQQITSLVDATILVNDGSFEKGQYYSDWTIVSNTTCESIGDWELTWGVAAYDGNFDFWGGGYCSLTEEPNTRSVSQTISVPSMATTLSVKIITYRTDKDDRIPDDYAYISVNDGEWITYLDLIQANDTYPNWVNIEFDLSAYAGEVIDLKLGAVSNGDFTGNIRFDLIEWKTGIVCTAPEDIPWISVSPSAGTTVPGDASLVEVTFDSTGLSGGSYSGNLCINSSDPYTPLVIVPLSMEVFADSGGEILLVDDDDNSPDVRSFYTDALDSMGKTYSIWDTGNSDNEPDNSILSLFEKVIWFTGDAYADIGTGFAGPGTSAEAALGQWLDTGKCLLISSQDYLYDHGFTPFMDTYLGVETAIGEAAHTMITGTSSVFGGLGPYILDYTILEGNLSDQITPDSTAELAFQGDEGAAAVNKDNGVYKTTYWGFPLEAITDPADRQDVLAAFLNWCRYRIFVPMIIR